MIDYLIIFLVGFMIGPISYLCIAFLSWSKGIYEGPWDLFRVSIFFGVQSTLIYTLYSLQ